MGKYSVPDHIRELKPKGTMVKCISGHYYVYQYSMSTDASGKRHTKMGKAIGTIKEGVGFISNSSYLVDTETSCLDYGEYAITVANSTDVYDLLKTCFNPEDATRIFIIAAIHYIHGFTYLKNLKSYYDSSVLSLRFKNLSFGYDSVAKLYDALGRRQGPVLEFERKLVEASTRQMAIDGHVIGSTSECNDLSGKGYKFGKLGETQINLLMAYDVNTGKPLLSRIYQGASPDKLSVQDFVTQIELKDMLFIVDRGFFSETNIQLFSCNGNAYIIPLSPHLSNCKKAVSDLTLPERFLYEKSKKSALIEYKEEMINGVRVLTYRDANEALLIKENYIRHMERKEPGYTQESFQKQSPLMGVIVLQTNLTDKSPKEIHTLYKKRWSIETYYNYFKNQAGYSELHVEDYYKMQGLAFIMLVAGLIHRNMENATKDIDGMSAQTCLLEAKMIKIRKNGRQWELCNRLKKQVSLFEKLNTQLSLDLAPAT